MNIRPSAADLMPPYVIRHALHPLPHPQALLLSPALSQHKASFFPPFHAARWLSQEPRRALCLIILFSPLLLEFRRRRSRLWPGSQNWTSKGLVYFKHFIADSRSSVPESGLSAPAWPASFALHISHIAVPIITQASRGPGPFRALNTHPHQGRLY